MDVLISAAKPLLKLSLEATLDLGGHKVVGPATTAASTLILAEADRPGLAFVQVGLRDDNNLAHVLRDRFGIPSFLVGAAAGDADEGRCAAWGLVREPCGSPTVPPGGDDRPGTSAGTSAGTTAAGSAAAADRALRPAGAVGAELHGQG